VVHAVVGGRVEDPLERSQPPDEPRVNPELVERVEGRDREEHRGRKAEERERQVEHPREGGLQGALPKRDREVVLLALVVDDVRGPSRAHLVAPAVEPVVEKVHPDEARDPGPGCGRGDLEQSVAREEPGVAGEQGGLEEDLRDLLQDAAGEVVDRVAQPVDVPLEDLRHEPLHSDEEEEDGDGELDGARVH
jgi:hypothetical protein